MNMNGIVSLGKRETMEKPIIIIDDNCLICNKFVQFVIAKDKKEKFLFSPFRYFFDHTPITVILIYEDKLYIRSSAVLKIMQILKFPWNLFSLFYIFPAVFLDFFYDFFSRQRYKLFGKSDSCLFMNSNLANRILKQDSHEIKTIKNMIHQKLI